MGLVSEIVIEKEVAWNLFKTHCKLNTTLVMLKMTINKPLDLIFD
jgi:hypothetical protein